MRKPLDSACAKNGSLRNAAWRESMDRSIPWVRPVEDVRTPQNGL